MRTELLKVGGGPDRFIQGQPSPLLGNMAEFMIAGLTEFDHLALAALIGDGAGTG